MISSLLESLYHQIMIYRVLAHSRVSTEFISSLSLVNFYDFFYESTLPIELLSFNTGVTSLFPDCQVPEFSLFPHLHIQSFILPTYFQMNNLFTGFHLDWVTNWLPHSVMYYSAMGKVMEPSSEITVKSTLESRVGRKSNNS